MNEQVQVMDFFRRYVRSGVTRLLRPYFYRVVIIATAVLSSTDVLAQSQRSYEEIPVDVALARDYSVRDGNAALERVRKFILNRDLTTDEKASVSLVKITRDSTPFLHEAIVGKVCWVVRIEGLLAGSEKIFDAFIDASEGRLLKIVSRLPEGGSLIPPLAAPEDAEKEMWRVGQEVYHGFPKNIPSVTFAEALSKLHRSNPLKAKQIIGRYVLNSSMGRPPRAVWDITTRGVPPHPRTPPHLPRTATYQYRELIDASTGAWLKSSNVPHPDYEKARATKAKAARP